MNTTMKKVMAVCLLAAISVSAFGCGKKNPKEDMQVETISLEQTKQDLTFDYAVKGSRADVTEAKEGNEDAPTDAPSDAPTEAATQQDYEEVTQVVNVTDEQGHGVVGNDGQPVTEYTVVATRPAQTPQQPVATQAPEIPVSQETKAPQASYAAAPDICQAYCLDMTQEGDYSFNGEFLTITFEINKDVPDGKYPVTIATTDIASWELVRYDPVIINGEVAVNADVSVQDEMSSSDFCLKVNSQAAKQGDIVTLTVDLSNNPGFCGFVIDIEYDSNAMTIIEASGGKDFDNAVNVAS